MKTRNRILAVLLCLCMVFSYAGYTPLAADTDTDDTSVVDVTQADVDSQAALEHDGNDINMDLGAVSEGYTEEASVYGAASTGIDYLVIENDYVVPGDEQYVLVGFGDNTAQSIMLNYSDAATGIIYQVNASVIDSGYALFYIDTAALSDGIYNLVSIDLINEGNIETINLVNEGINASFGVNIIPETSPYGWLVEDNSESDFDADGVIVNDVTSGDITVEDISKAINEGGIIPEVSDDLVEETIGAKGGAEFIVVLDPGHGAGDTGATRTHNGVTYIERDLNLKIALACKEELERLGLTVYMTRYDNSTKPGLGERAEIAKSYDADILVSIHNNSQTADTARGSEVWVPNSSPYNYYAYETGQDLGNRILSNLGALGLNKRGVFTRYATDGDTYPTGDTSDYYTVINESRRRGIPAMIIEHAYVSNAADAAQFLGSDASLKNLGIADATAIYNYYKSLPLDYEDGSASITYGDYGNGSYTLVADGVPDAYNVSFNITAVKSGKTITVGAIKGGDRWFADFNVDDFGVTGTYNIEAYVNKRNYKSYRVGSTKLTVGDDTIEETPAEGDATIIAFNADGDNSIILIAANVPNEGKYSKLWFNITAPDGQSIDYGSMAVEGGWLALMAVKDFKQSGTYTVKAYNNYNSNANLVGQTTFYITPPTAESIGIENLNNNKGTFDIVVRGVQSNTGVTSLRIPAFTKGDLSDLYWYTAEKTEDGTYVAHASIKNHNNNYGVYAMQAYITTGNGIEVVPVSNCVEVAKPTPAVWAYDLGDNNTFIMGTDNLPYGDDIASAKFAIWNEGLSDLRWYNATSDASGRWLAFLNISTDYKKAGTYVGDAYITYKNGTTEEVGLTFFFVDEPKASGMHIENANNTAGTFDVVVDGVSCKSGITGVRIPVWSELNLGDLHWYDAVKQSDGTYKATVDIRNHKNHYAVYIMQAYLTSGSGIETIPVDNAYFFTQPSDQLYPIAGTSCTTIDQMVSYYKKNATYPEFYTDSDAPTIEDFCRIYYEECEAEGIRAEVAFCQCLKETGFLKFGGDVKIEQYNFCGLGAVGGGAEGQYFDSVRLGIRAHVQHLKAYANKDALNNDCVDPRFSLVARGVAPYVEWLGINENPYGKGWASAVRYGYSLKDGYMSKMMGN